MIVERVRTMPVIYKTTNLINGKIYIGKSLKNESSYLGSGLKLTAALKKYGRNNFQKEIIEECDYESLNQKEIYWISFYNSTDDKIGYNVSIGGDGGSHYWSSLTEDQKKEHNNKISLSKKGKNKKPHSVETKTKQSLNYNRDPLIIKKRSLARCKPYTCVNHETREVFFTKNLSEFCENFSLNKEDMQYNSRARKNFYKSKWSCRKGIMEGDSDYIISVIEKEVKEASEKIKTAIRAVPKSGEKNGMFAKKHSIETKEKLSQARKKYWKLKLNEKSKD